MPITKSAKKALRISQRNAAFNLKITHRLKKETKQILAQIKSGKAKGEKISQVLSIIDKAAKMKIIHKNKAARLKSKITKAAFTKKIKLGKRERKATGKERPKIKRKKAKPKVKTKK